MSCVTDQLINTLTHEIMSVYAISHYLEPIQVSDDSGPLSGRPHIMNLIVSRHKELMKKVTRDAKMEIHK